MPAKGSAFALAFCLIVACDAYPQTAGTHEHSQTMTIDGAAHPDLISDLTAYRLYFLMVSNGPDAGDAERSKHVFQLRKVGLGSLDNQALVAILTAFKAQYRLLIDNYNQQARDADARGDHPDVQGLKAQRDQLVETTLANVRSALTANGCKLLDAYVQAEKQKMRISVTGGAQ